MSKNLPNMLESTIAKIRELVDANSVVGQAVTTPDGVTIIPISRISVGLGGGGSDFVSSKKPAGNENPFGGGVGAGVTVSPVAFLVVKEGSVRVLPVAVPASTTADRIVDLVPDALDKIAGFVDSRKKEE